MLYVSSGKKISILQGQGAAIGAVGALSLEPPYREIINIHFHIFII
jgi:hypothetical protein